MLCVQVLNQVSILLRELCRLHSIPEPADIARLTMPSPQTVAHNLRLPERLEDDKEMEEEDEDEEEEGEDDFHLEMDEGDSIAKSKVENILQIVVSKIFNGA